MIPIFAQNLLFQCEVQARGYFEAPSIIDLDKQVLLASFPKSGNTWLRFLVSNVNAILLGEDKADFWSIEKLAPVIRGNRNLVDAKVPQNAPLFLKTHFPHTKYFKNHKSIVIVRDPFKVIPSYYEFLTKARDKNMPEMNEFMFHWRYGFNAWGNFMESWDTHGTMIIKYEDLQENTLGVLKDLYLKLGYEIEDEIITKAIEFSSRSQMKKQLKDVGDPHNTNNFNFVKNVGENKGVIDRKNEILSGKGLSKVFYKQAKKYGYIL